MISSNKAVNTTAVKLVDASLEQRVIYLHVVGNNPIYLGNSAVTTSTGLQTEKHTTPIEIVLPANEDLWAISAAAENVRVLIPSLHNG